LSHDVVTLVVSAHRETNVIHLITIVPTTVINNHLLRDIRNGFQGRQRNASKALSLSEPARCSSAETKPFFVQTKMKLASRRMKTSEKKKLIHIFLGSKNTPNYPENKLLHSFLQSALLCVYMLIFTTWSQLLSRGALAVKIRWIYLNEGRSRALLNVFSTGSS